MMKRLEDLQRSLSEGRLNRREFIKRATALGLAGAVPSVILIEEARSQTRKHGGRFRQGLNGGSNSDTLFGVLGAGGTHQRNVQWQLLNNLTAVTADNEVVGELAESLEPSADAKVWVFNVRKGVEFHSGKTLEAEDIIHSLNQHRGDDSKSTGKGLFAIVDDIKADGKDTVVFSLSSGSADFPCEMYVEMQKLIRDEGGLVAPVFANTLSANSTKLRMSEKISGLLSNEGEKNTENWSFA